MLAGVCVSSWESSEHELDGIMPSVLEPWSKPQKQQFAEGRALGATVASCSTSSSSSEHPRAQLLALSSQVTDDTAFAAYEQRRAPSAGANATASSTAHAKRHAVAFVIGAGPKRRLCVLCVEG